MPASRTVPQFLFACCLLLSACSGGEAQPPTDYQVPTEPLVTLRPGPPIADYIRHIHEDQRGHLWLGTNGRGVAHYDDAQLRYYAPAQGFQGEQITGIAEDAAHNLWFATDRGAVKYEAPPTATAAPSFTNYPAAQHFDGLRLWSIFVDSRGSVWAGTARGIFRFDGRDWLPFALPYPETETGDFVTPSTTWGITEDRAGHLWFSTNGHGAFRYDGQAFSQLTEQDGLSDNSVDVIL
ncbi:MAG: two-component regulator propeller domain-containing protein, partial [Bacteroidota bacterium]